MNVPQPPTALERHVALERKHSGFGITSFIMSIVSGFIMAAIVVIAGVLETSTEGGMSEDSPAAILVGLAVMGTGLLVLLGLGFGIAGVCQSERKKVFAILGIALNCLIIAGVAGLMVLGTMVE